MLATLEVVHGLKNVFWKEGYDRDPFVTQSTCPQHVRLQENRQTAGSRESRVRQTVDASGFSVNAVIATVMKASITLIQVNTAVANTGDFISSVH
jgi:hypothetical protein